MIVSDVVTHVTTSSETQITISPAIITGGAYQNVNSAPGSKRQDHHLPKHPYGGLQAEHDLPQGSVSSQIDGAGHRSGHAVRRPRDRRRPGLDPHRQDYDITNDEILTRCDILYGVKALEPEKATRLSGTA